MSITLNCGYYRTVRPIQKIFKLSSDGGDSGSKKCRRVHNDAHGEVWRSLHLARVCNVESGGRFCVGVFGSNVGPVVIKSFFRV
jgi:hypothetical protein